MLVCQALWVHEWRTISVLKELTGMRVWQTETLMTWGEMLRWGSSQGLGILGDWPINNGQELARQGEGGSKESSVCRPRGAFRQLRPWGGHWAEMRLGRETAHPSKDLRLFLKAVGCH